MANISSCNKCGGTIIFRKMDGKTIPIHLSGKCSAKNVNTNSSGSFQSRVKRQQKKLQQRKQLVENFTIPNASCPKCGANVFYYENEYGSKVFFDELGPPWPKHPCTDNGSTQESKNGSAGSSDKKDVWKRFYTTCLRTETKNDAIRIHWDGFFELEEGIWSKEIGFMTESPIEPNVIDLKTVFIAQTKGGKIALSMMTEEDILEPLRLTTKKKKLIALGTERLGKEDSPRKYYVSRKGRTVLKGKTNVSILNPKKQQNRKIRKKKEDSYQDIIGLPLQPVDVVYDCPLCTSAFTTEKKREYHLREHWLYDDLGIFEGVSFKKWKDLILSDNTS